MPADITDRFANANHAGRKHLVQPWPMAASIGDEARAIIGSGDGIYIENDHGQRLIDGPAGMWCTNVGHRNQALADVMRDQALRLSYNSPWYSSNEPAALLAQRIADHAPGDLEHVFFTTGGSTAIDSALRFVQFYNNIRGRSGKKKILAREGGYHGSTYLAASLNGGLRTRDWMDYDTDLVIKLACPDPFRRPQGASIADFTAGLITELRTTIAREGADSIAAFVAEPLMASGGVIVPPPGYLEQMHEVCAEHDILYISDEVVTGFGRLGHIFASRDEFNVQPDILTFAKGVTSGYFPLGGMVVSARLMAQLRASNHPEAAFAHGLTYSSHPIGCAVALKNLDLLEGGILQHVRSVIPYFRQQMKTLENLPLVGEVRGIGLMACIECVADKTDKNPIRLDTEVGNRIDAHCQALGLLLRPIVHMCVLSPPLIITKQQIKTMTDILREGIIRTQNDLRTQGMWQG